MHQPCYNILLWIFSWDLVILKFNIDHFEMISSTTITANVGNWDVLGRYILYAIITCMI
jgi:hypothetical protein